MKELIVAMAEYNAAVNQKVVELLRGVDRAVLVEDQGSFYRSLLGTLEHIALSEVNMLRRFGGFFPYACLEGNPLMSADPAALKAKIHDDSAATFDLLASADQALLALCGELDPPQLSRRVTYRNYKGEELERLYWAMIVHIFNHGTHHRGEISALLDRRGVSNDFSGFANYIK